MTDTVQHIDDVKSSDRRKLNALSVKNLAEDGAFWFALFVVASRLYPPVGEWAEQNRDALIPLYVVLAGHFGIRMVSTKAKGNVLSGDNATAIARVEK